MCANQTAHLAHRLCGPLPNWPWLVVGYGPGIGGPCSKGLEGGSPCSTLWQLLQSYSFRGFNSFNSISRRARCLLCYFYLTNNHIWKFTPNRNSSEESLISVHRLYHYSSAHLFIYIGSVQNKHWFWSFRTIIIKALISSSLFPLPVDDIIAWEHEKWPNSCFN